MNVRIFFVLILFLMIPCTVVHGGIGFSETDVQSFGAPLGLNIGSTNAISFANGAMYILPASGFVGVGTQSPSYPLHVVGVGNFANAVGSATPIAGGNAATKSYVDSILGGGVGSGTAGQTLRNNGSGWVGSSLLYNNATNIGVGTTNPLAPFHTYSATPSGGLVSIFQSGGATGYIQIQSTGSSWQIGATGNGLELYNNNTSASRATLTNAGSLGLGTQAPAYTLDVRGTASFTSPVIVGTPTQASHAATKNYIDSALASFWVTTSTNMYAGNSGNVGIGTNAPATKLQVAGGVYATGIQIGTSTVAGRALTTDANGVGTWQALPGTSASLPGGSVLTLHSTVPSPQYSSFTFESRTNPASYFTCPTGYSLWSDINANWYGDENGNNSSFGACYPTSATNDVFIWKSYSSPSSVVCPSGYTQWNQTSFYGRGIYSSYTAYPGACYKGAPSSFKWEVTSSPGSVTCPAGYTNWYDSNAQWYSSTSGYYNYTGSCYNASATTDVFSWRANSSPSSVTCPSGYTKWYPSNFAYGPGSVSYYTGVCYKGSPASFPWEIYTAYTPSSSVTCPSGYTNWYDTTYAKYYTYDGSYQSYNGVCVNTSISTADAFPYFSTTGSDGATCPLGYTKWQGNASYYTYRGSSNAAYSSACYKTYQPTGGCQSCPSGWTQASCQIATENGTDVSESVCYATSSPMQAFAVLKKGTSQSISCPIGLIPAGVSANVGGNTELMCFNGCPSGMTAPGAPTGLSASAGSQKANLSWTAPSGATCAQAQTYNIYRSLTSGSGYSLLASTTDVTYSDTSVTPSGAATYTEPQSTGNRTSLITITADTIWNYSGYPDTNMFDGNSGTVAYISATDITGRYITFDFGTARIIKEARYTWNNGAQSGTWKWQASNDNSTWTDVTASFVPNGSGNPQPCVLGDMSANNTAYRYYRWIGVSGTGYNNGGALEIEFKILGNGSYPTYYYKVSAANSGGEGSQSTEVSVTPINFTPVTFSNTSTGRSGTIQSWTVPTTGAYTIEAWGAQGGSGSGSSLTGGKGAHIKGTVSLTAGEVIKILVGQQGMGSGGAHGNENGGGGGTFVVKQTGNVPLIIAGGGGGGPATGYGTSCTRTAADGDGKATNSGTSISCNSSASGGTSGSGGYTAGSYQGGGGGGLTTAGQDGGSHCAVAYGGQSYVSGGVGGTGNTCYGAGNGLDNAGGFGGGGGGQLGGPGAGGGYSGGATAASWSSYSTYGGGGGSYNAGTNQTNESGIRSGNGAVVISM